MPKHFVVLFYHFSPAIYTVDFIDGLLDEGHKVTVLWFRADKDACFPHPKNDALQIVICTYEEMNNSLFLRRLLIGKIANKLFPSFFYNQHAKLALKIAEPYIQQADAIIGIEKGGLYLACKLAAHNQIPYFYYSLELYLDDHIVYTWDKLLHWLRKKEPAAHANAAGTIIQCQKRFNHLCHANKVNSKLLLFPVVAPRAEGIKQHEKSATVAAILQHCASKKICLLFGYNRFSDDFLLNLHKSFPLNHCMLFQDKHDGRLQSFFKNNALSSFIASNASLDEAEIFELIGSASIGICYYQDDSVNDKLTAFSSEKLSRYLQQGLPVIGNKSTNLPELLNTYPCGIAIETPQDFVEAIGRIEDNYETYSTAARQAHAAYFKFDQQFPRLHQEILACIEDSLASANSKKRV